jgi:hypothetical protein
VCAQKKVELTQILQGWSKMTHMGRQ